MTSESDGPTAEYVFRVRFRVDPADPDVTLEPNRFETVLRKRAATPGEEGWLFFRDNCWRGEASDERHLRELAAETLGVEVEAVSFSELRTDAAYLDAFREAIEADLTPFRADSVEEVIRKYLGSSVRVE